MVDAWKGEGCVNRSQQKGGAGLSTEQQSCYFLTASSDPPTYMMLEQFQNNRQCLTQDFFNRQYWVPYLSLKEGGKEMGGGDRRIVG